MTPGGWPLCCYSVGYAPVAMAEYLSDHQPRYVEIDVSEWGLSGEEVLGTKPKRWLIKPDTDERWLMKDATFNPRKDGTAYRKGDDWAERVAYGVALVLGVPAARVELCVNRKGEGEVYGTICRSVLEGQSELVLGNALLAGRGVHVTKRNPSSYTLEAIHLALEHYQSPPGTLGGLPAWTAFVGYLMLDALIGNTDRHEENWGVVVSESGRYLAPTFDHASSLGFLLSDRQRRRRMSSKDSNYTPEAFADRARSRFAAEPHPIAAVREARGIEGGDAVDLWLNQLERIDDLVAPIRAIPEHRMSVPARKFAERVMLRNWIRLTGSSSR